MFEKGVAVVAISKWGTATAAKIADALERAEIKNETFAPKQFRSNKATTFDVGLHDLFANLFHRYDAIIAVMATGIVVRSIAPHISSKITDPAIIVVDDTGKYAISLLSGHSRGANKLTKIVAHALGAIPVITTATELLNKKSVEEIAEEHNLQIVNYEATTKINSAIVNERRILIATNNPMTCPKIEGIDPELIPNIEELIEIMKSYDAGILISQNTMPLESLTDSVALLIPKQPPRSPSENHAPK